MAELHYFNKKGIYKNLVTLLTMRHSQSFFGPQGETMTGAQMLDVWFSPELKKPEDMVVWLSPAKVTEDGKIFTRAGGVWSMIARGNPVAD